MFTTTMRFSLKLAVLALCLLVVTSYPGGGIQVADVKADEDSPGRRRCLEFTLIFKY